MSVDQLTIQFSNHKRSDFWSYISHKLEPVTNNIPLTDWIELIADNIYLQSKQDSTHVDLRKYLPLRLVKYWKYNKDLLVNARLLCEDNSFIIELRDYGEWNDSRLQRYFLAHEIAHTFFYDIKSTPIKEFRFFSYGSKEIEFVCNRIARSLLMPNAIFTNKLYKLPSLNDDAFSLDAVNSLSRYFRVPSNVFLNRVIFDTGYWNCLLLRFRLYDTEKNKWKLRERYLPSKYWQNSKAYIPQEDARKDKENPKRFPSAKGKLNDILDKVHSELIVKQNGWRNYEIFDLSDDPIKSFLQYYFCVFDVIKVHFSLGRDKYSKAEYINICIPLPN